MLKRNIKRLLIIVLIFSLTAVIYSQSRGTPNNLRVLTDASGALLVAAAGQTLPLSQPTTFSNTRLATDASGNLLVVISGGEAAGVTSIAGTTNQIIASAATGAVTLSTPQNIGTTSSVTFGNVNVPSAGAFTYNSVNVIQALTATRSFFFANSGNLTMTGIDNIAIGNGALAANTTGQLNIAIGTSALALSSTGNSSTAVGYKALSKSVGDSNTAIGKESMRENLAGNSNVAVGPATLLLNTTGSGNVIVGHSAAAANTDGSNNVVVGTSAFGANQSGGNNVAVGTNSLLVATSDNNTAVGRNSGVNVTSGGYNTIVGFTTGGGITTGQANTIIGGQLNGLASTLSNNVIIGDGFGTVRLQIDNVNKVMLGRAMSLTAPTIASGGCTSPAVTWNGGTSAFLLTLGSSCTGIKTLTLTMPTATNLWACNATNNTSDAQQAANYVVARATSVTAVVLTNYTRTTGVQADFTAADTLLVQCIGG